MEPLGIQEVRVSEVVEYIVAGLEGTSGKVVKKGI
jgi:hypothetical protein